MNEFARNEAERIVTAVERIAAATRIVVMQGDLNFAINSEARQVALERLIAEDRRTLGLPE